MVYNESLLSKLSCYNEASLFTLISAEDSSAQHVIYGSTNQIEEPVSGGMAWIFNIYEFALFWRQWTESVSYNVKCIGDFYRKKLKMDSIYLDDLWKKVILGSVIGLVSLNFLRKYVKGALANGDKNDFKSNTVYVFAFPRKFARQLLNLSPFVIKLESWLRLKGVKYEVSVKLYQKCYYITRNWNRQDILTKFWHFTKCTPKILHIVAWLVLIAIIQPQQRN